MKKTTLYIIGGIALLYLLSKNKNKIDPAKIAVTNPKAAQDFQPGLNVASDNYASGGSTSGQQSGTSYKTQTPIIRPTTPTIKTVVKPIPTIFKTVVNRPTIAPYAKIGQGSIPNPLF